MIKFVRLKLFSWKVINSIQSSAIVTTSIRMKILSALGSDISSNAAIAENVYIGSNNLKMGIETFINTGSFIDGCAPVILEDYVRCGPYVKILTGTHKYRNSVIRRRSSDGLIAKPVIIKKGCWIGMGSIILPGVTIAEGCIVAAGTVIVRDTEPNGLYAGNPAKRVKELPITEDNW